MSIPKIPSNTPLSLHHQSIGSKSSSYEQQVVHVIFDYELQENRGNEQFPVKTLQFATKKITLF